MQNGALCVVLSGLCYNPATGLFFSSSVWLPFQPSAAAGSVALKQAPTWVQSLYQDHYHQDPRAFIEWLQYRQQHNISRQELFACITLLARQFPSNVNNEHIIALLGNQPIQAP